MKRSLVLTLGCSLAAALFAVPSAGAQTTTSDVVRALPTQVTSSVTPRRERFRPYTFTTRGRLIPPPRYCTPGQNPGSGANNCVPAMCPPGLVDPRYCLFPAAGVICSGRINVRFQKRNTTISSRNVSVRPDCTYRSRVTFRLLLPTRRGSLRVRARFQGNAVLLPRNSSTKIVRAG